MWLRHPECREIAPGLRHAGVKPVLKPAGDKYGAEDKTQKEQRKVTYGRPIHANERTRGTERGRNESNSYE